MYIHTNTSTHMCQNICGPLSPLRAPWWESQEMLWLVADRRAAGDWKTRRSDDCQWLGSASNYWLASNDWTAIVSSITFISSITSARYLTGHSARGTCAVRARPGRGNVQAVTVASTWWAAGNLVSCSQCCGLHCTRIWKAEGGEAYTCIYDQIRAYTSQYIHFCT